MKGHSCLIILMKHDLCDAISNPSGYTIIGEWSKQPCPEGRHTSTKWGGMHNPEMEADAKEKGMSWVLATTPTNPTAIKISWAKHVQWEDRNSLLCHLPLWRPFFWAQLIIFFVVCRKQNISPVATHEHMC